MFDKIRKQNRLALNKMKGKFEENLSAAGWASKGYDVKRTGRGSDFEVTKKNFFTGKVEDKRLVEVKSGKAKLSKLQKKTQKSTKNYTVDRRGW